MAYAASKGAIAAMTLPMARDFCSMGIRVNCIAPGKIVCRGYIVADKGFL